MGTAGVYGAAKMFWTTAAVPKVGILGSLVWDQIYGRDPLAPPVEEWGGVAYALGGTRREPRRRGGRSFR